MKRYIIGVILLFSATTAAWSQMLRVVDSLAVDSSLQKTFMRSMSYLSLESPQIKEQILSPQATLMKQYGDFPVNLANGLVDISIPLYEVKTPNLALPVNMSFHASGLRTDEQEGSLGIRWLLNAGGIITRQVKGYKDELAFSSDTYHGFPKEMNSPGYRLDFMTFYGATHPSLAMGEFGQYSSDERFFTDRKNGKFKDTQYDIFSYQLPTGKSGRFILTQGEKGEIIPQTLPYEPINIKVLHQSYDFTQIVITDESGIKYYFGLSLGDGKSHIERNGELNTTNSWYLTDIVSPNGEIISFDYETTYGLGLNYFGSKYKMNDEMYTTEGEYLVYDSYYGGPTTLYEAISPYFYPTFEKVKIVDQNRISSKQISKIRFKGGHIEFKYEEFRTTMKVYDPYPYSTSYSVLSRLLRSISIYSHNEKIKNISFTYHERQQNTSPFLLGKITMDGGMPTRPEVYNFEYYDRSYMPSLYDLREKSDWWGYYSKNSSEFIFDDKVIRTVMDPTMGSTRSKVYETIPGGSTKDGDLNSMKTGMIESITYPTGGKSVFNYEAHFETYGGLRIKSVENQSGNGIVEKKEYVYNDGRRAYMPNHLYYLKIGNRKEEIRHYIYVEAADWNVLPGDRFDVGRAVYTETTFQNSIPERFLGFYPRLAYYDKVTEYISSSTSKLGKTEYIYDYPYIEDTPFNAVGGGGGTQFDNFAKYYKFYIQPPRYGEDPVRLISKKVYSSNPEKLIEEHIYGFTNFSKGIVRDIITERSSYFSVSSIDDTRESEIRFTYQHDAPTLYTRDFWAIGGWGTRKYELGASRLTKETINEYFDSGMVTTIKETSYDNERLMPIEEKVTNSDKNISSTRYKYPFHYTGDPYTAMVGSNILTPVIEKSIYKNSTFQERLIANYKSVTAKDNIQYEKSRGPLDTRIKYSYHDKDSFPREIIKDDCEKIVYLRNAYGLVVAEIINANYTEVSRILGTAVIDRIANSYIVSSSDMALINGLRGNTNLNAHITTYTYKPLVGMTSATDPSGKTTTYEYDAFGRLARIIDHEGDIIEEYMYNYRNK